MGVNPKEWTDACGKRFREKYRLDDKLTVFFAGTKAYDKGAIHLLRAIKIVQEKINIVLVAAGFKTKVWIREVKRLNK